MDELLNADRTASGLARKRTSLTAENSHQCAPESCESGTRGSASRETLERIRAVFADSLHLNHEEVALTHEQMLDHVASIDSIAVLEFLTAVEKAFGVELEPAVLEFEFFRDVEALARYIEDRMRRSSEAGVKRQARAAGNDGE
jgi:acyl carrier protein